MDDKTIYLLQVFLLEWWERQRGSMKWDSFYFETVNWERERERERERGGGGGEDKFERERKY